MAGVTLKNVKKVYDKNVVAVHDFNLEIADKEFVVFVGPSGCGKSTTLRMIAGLEDITGGECYIGEALVNQMPPKDRDIAMVFQNYALYPHMTVFENMAFALKLRKTPKDEVERRVREAAEILDITEYLPRKPKALSGGQRQRVAIGRAIVRNPQVFLMDEPLSNLDAKLRNQMRAELLQLRRRVDTTFVYVTHDQTEAMTLGDRIVVMKDGYIMQTGTPSEVFDHPANLFVAGFIGTPQMNFFEHCALKREGGTYHLELCGNVYALPADKQEKLRELGIESQDVTVGARPEDVRLAAECNETPVQGRINVIESMGSEMIVHASIEQKPIVMRVTRKDTMEAMREYIDGSKEVALSFDVERIHLFHQETGENILFG